MAEREFWKVSRMFVGVLERAEIEQLKERFARLQAEVMPVPGGNRVMIELTTEAENASEASERVEQLLHEHLPSRGRLEPGVGCTEPLRFSPDVPTELQSLRDKIGLLAEEYRLLSNPLWLEDQGLTADDFRQDLRDRVTECRQLLDQFGDTLASEP